MSDDNTGNFELSKGAIQYLEAQTVTQGTKKSLDIDFTFQIERAIKNSGNGGIYNCTLLGVLFSAGWSSPCRLFYKDLIDIYKKMNDGEKIFEIIQISFDEKEEDFNKNPPRSDCVLRGGNIERS